MADAYKFSQMIGDNLKNTYRYFGESEHGATVIACSIAVFKGIFRPLFTMMDKKSDPEAKKYAAIREGLTEVAAFPLYAVTPLIAGKIAEKIADGADELVKKRIKTNAKFFGICAATLAIPFVCNVIQPPIMDMYKKSQEAKKAKVGNEVAFTGNIKTPTLAKTNQKYNPMRKTSLYTNSGMRVGN